MKGRAVLVLAAVALAAVALRAPSSLGQDGVDAAEKDLAEGAPARREEAVERLRALPGARAREVLLRALQDTDWGVQAKAAAALGARGDRDLVAPLARVAVEGEVEFVRAAARAAMAAADAAGAAARLQIAARQTQDARVRARCLLAFGETAPGDQWKGVADSLGHREPRVAAAAVAALGRIAERHPSSSGEILPVLEKMLGARADRRQAFAYAAALDSLGRTADPRAVDLLVGEVASMPDEDGHAPERAARALLRHDAAAAAAALETALGKARSPEALRRLLRLEFVVSVADAGEPAGIAALQPYMDDASWRVASAAVVTVGTLGVEADRPLVEPRLRHRDWRIRAAAFEALGRLRAVTAVPLLAAGLDDRDPVVKGVCLANLQILTREKGDGTQEFWQRWYEARDDEFVLVKRSRRSPEEKKKDAENRPKYAHEIRRYGVEILQKARILVVEGAWDKAQNVLSHLEIPHTLLRAQQLKTAGLNPNQVVLVNCEGNLDKDSAARIQWFVNVGGYLMSTDWALTKAVNICFPGYVKQFSGSNTGNDVVEVEEATPGHPFTEAVFENVPAMMWWLEIQAFPIEVEYPEPCEVIVDSVEMRHRDGSSPMAAAFRWGLGKVQHSLSHFYLQEEGMTRAAKPRDRMVFAVDHLGVPFESVRALAAEGRFEGKLNEETMKRIAPDYSMFRLIVNVVAEKSRWVEDL